jgi:hypothetical protein
LNDPSLPAEILAISHCGIGISAVELARFEPSGIGRLIDSFSNPAYRLYGYENVGAMLGVYEPDAFSLAARGLALFGVLPIVPLRHPAHETFLASFDPEARRLISHGYGRMLFFKHSTLGSAVKAARRARYFDLGACVQGMAFGSSMVNSKDLNTLWEACARMKDEEVRRHFGDGLAFALAFWEWMAPRSLEALSPRTGYASDLIGRAMRGVAIGRAGGALPAFAVLG